MALLTATTYFFVYIILAREAFGQGTVLNCASCENATCPPEPTNCALDRVPCGCCNVCSLSNGETCSGFSSSCGPGLICLTPGGVFDERPPWFSLLKGICVYENAPTPGHMTPPILFHHSTTLAAVLGRK